MDELKINIGDLIEAKHNILLVLDIYWTQQLNMRFRQVKMRIINRTDTFYIVYKYDTLMHYVKQNICKIISKHKHT